MPKKRTQLAIIFLTIFIDMVGFGIVIPVLPLYAELPKFGANSLQIGWLVGVYSAMQIVFSPLLGKLSDRVGRRPVLLMSVIGTSFGFVVMGFAQTLWVLFAARIIDGISGGNISTAQAYIADVTDPAERAKFMGFIGAAFGLGFIFGPVIGGLMSHYGLAAPFFFAAGLALVNAGFIFALLPESLDPEHRSDRRPKQSMGDVFRHANGSVLARLMVTYFLSITGFSIMTTLYALFMKHRFHYDARHTGYIFAYIGTLGVIIQGGLLGRLVKAFGERRLATAGAVILAASLFALPLCTSIKGILAVCAGIAFGNGFLTPTINGLASRNVDKTWQGRALGMLQSSGSLGRTVGPALAGWLLTFDSADRYARTPFFVSGALLIVTFLLMLTLAKEQVIAPAEVAARA